MVDGENTLDRDLGTCARKIREREREFKREYKKQVKSLRKICAKIGVKNRFRKQHSN